MVSPAAEVRQAKESAVILKNRLKANKGKAGELHWQRVRDAMDLFRDAEFVNAEFAGDLNYARERIVGDFLDDIVTVNDRTFEKLELAFLNLGLDEWRRLGFRLDDIIEEAIRRTTTQKRMQPQPPREVQRAKVADLEAVKQEKADLEFRLKKETEARQKQEQQAAEQRERAEHAERQAREREQARLLAEAEKEEATKQLAEVEAKVEQLPEPVREIVKTKPVKEIKEAVALIACPTCGGCGKVPCK